MGEKSIVDSHAARNGPSETSITGHLRVSVRVPWQPARPPQYFPGTFCFDLLPAATATRPIVQSAMPPQRSPRASVHRSAGGGGASWADRPRAEPGGVLPRTTTCGPGRWAGGRPWLPTFVCQPWPAGAAACPVGLWSATLLLRPHHPHHPPSQPALTRLIPRGENDKHGSSCPIRWRA